MKSNRNVDLNERYVKFKSNASAKMSAFMRTLTFALQTHYSKFIFNVPFSHKCWSSCFANRRRPWVLYCECFNLSNLFFISIACKANGEEKKNAPKYLSCDEFHVHTLYENRPILFKRASAFWGWNVWPIEQNM